MAGPSTGSPSPSSGSDDFAALLDAELQTSQEESRAEEHSEEEVEANGEGSDGSDGSDESNEDSAFEDDLPGETSVVSEEVEGEDGGDDFADDRRKIQSRMDFAGEVDVAAGRLFERAKRKREEEENDLKSDSKGSCPPHPGFMWGVCIRCGKTREVSNDEPVPTAVALRYIHEGLEVSETEAARIRRDELRRVMSRKKLFLVLDLDHTLLNSARFIEVYPEEEAYLSDCYGKEPDPRYGEPQFINGLNRLTHLQMWTKIRPFAFEFIEAASKMFEMYIYTMGERTYALAMARLLDPTGRLFGERIISQGDSTRSTTKDLDVVLGAESAVLILDDTEGVWPKHRANLILMERYHFFRFSCMQFGLKSLSLTQRQKDESDRDGTLARALKTLQEAHHAVFGAAPTMERAVVRGNTDREDVREVIDAMRGRILKGCRVVFSRIFPVGMLYPDSHPFWRLTAEMGAHCSTVSNSATTHVIALDRGTEKARWARQNKKHLVHPSWVEAAQYLWVRPREEDFPVGTNSLEPPTATFSKTVDVTSQKQKPEPLASCEAAGLSKPNQSQGTGSTGKDGANEVNDNSGEEKVEAVHRIASPTE